MYNIPGDKMYNNYVEVNKNNLLAMYGMIYSSKELDLMMGLKDKPSTVKKEACLDAVLLHKYNGGVVDFPIKYPREIPKSDIEDAKVLYSIALCEEAVCSGFLTRKKTKYLQQKTFDISAIPNYNKYIILMRL